MPERIDSKFRYVLLSAARAEQLIRGSSARMPSEGPKVSRVAMDEILTDSVEWDYGPAPEPQPEEADEEGDEGSADDSA